MKWFVTIGLICLASLSCLSQQMDRPALQAEFKDFIEHYEKEFIYYEDKKEIIACIRDEYYQSLDTISHPFYKILFYEKLLNELYDSHIHLTTNTDQSYRLNSPIYIQEIEGVFRITSVFTSQIDVDFPNISQAQVLSFNDQTITQAIKNFPSYCHDKNDPKIREWLANKILAGRINQSRILELQLTNGNRYTLDMDQIHYRADEGLLISFIRDNIGYIRLNNSLGENDLVEAFNETLDQMMNTQALILDLRNTPSGGNSSVAEPIMGRFVLEKSAYQLCENINERYLKYITPTGTHYNKPLYVLVGRWTGSMGEGMAIGFDGMKRAKLIGTEMYRLAGGMKTVQLINSNFGARMSIEKLYHLNGSLRERFIPIEYINQSDVTKDQVYEHSLKLISQH